MPPWGETPAEQEGAGGVFPQPSLPPLTEEKPGGRGRRGGGAAAPPPSQCASLTSVTRILPEAGGGP